MGKKENRKRGAILKMFTLRLAHWSASDATESAEYEETTMEGLEEEKRRRKRRLQKTTSAYGQDDTFLA